MTPAGNGFLLIGPVGAAYLKRALELTAVQHRQNGIRPGENWAILRDAVEQAAAFAYETANFPSASDMGASAPGCISVRIGAGRVSEMLACSPQWARALLRRGVFGSARRVGPVWTVDESEVAAWVVERAADSDVAA